MKKLLLLLILLPSSTFSQNWQWARHIGSRYSDNNVIAEVITDGNNAYVIGTFSVVLYTMNDTLSCNGENDMFIAKYDQNGNELWVKSFGGNNPYGSHEFINGVYDTNNQCIFLGGCYYDKMYLDSLQPLYAVYGGTDIFIIKIDLNGTFLWAKSLGSKSSDRSQIFKNPDGKIILAGTVYDSAYFDTIKVSRGGYISIFDTNGKCLWARKCSDKFSESYLHLAFIENDIILTGYFSTPSMHLDSIQLTNSGKLDAFIVRFDSTGRVKWYKKIGGKGEEFICALKKDQNNDLYVTGCFSDTVIVDTDTIYNAVRDYFLLKLDQNGNLIWINQGYSSGHPDGSYGYDIQTDQYENIYVLGTFSGSALFGGTLKLSDKVADFFLAKYTSNGNCIGFTHGGKGYGEKIAIDNQGYIFYTIGIRDTFSIENNVLVSYGTKDDIVIAKSGPLGTGIQPAVPDNLLFIYANPSSGKCTIKIPGEFQNKNKLVLCIYDFSGKKMFENVHNAQNQELRINLEFKAKGIYPVTLSDGKKMYKGKIIVQ